jgi:sugar lactone lactonase YvrE
MRYTRPLVVFFLPLILVTCREIDDLEPNMPPVAEAGDGSEVFTGQTVALSGAESFDPDNDPLSFTWTLLEKPQSSQTSIADFDSVSAEFTPDQSGIYRIRLQVSDNIESDSDTVEIVAFTPNGAPVANAGSDGKTDLGAPFQLSGSGTDPDGDPLTYTWSLTSRPAGSLAAVQSPQSQNTSFTPDKPGSYTATLTVSDGSFSDSDEVVVTINNVDVTAINPTSGAAGITVKVSGKNFSPVPAENTVRFNGTAATVTTASYTSLDVVVPLGAGTGAVSVTVNSVTDNGPVFTYLQTPFVSNATQFDSPYFVTSDANGNIYISDFASHVIRRLTPQGQLTIIAGNGQAGYLDAKDPLQAQFNRPAGLAIDANNNLYVADRENHCIRRISLSSGDVSTIAGFPQAGYSDGQGQAAQFSSPIGLGIDGSGVLYVGDFGNYMIRRVTALGVVTTLAGNGQPGFADGTGQAAQFAGVAGVTVDASNNIYVADALNNRIRKVNGQGTVTTLAGGAATGLVNGTGTAARFNTPHGVGCDANGNVYVADFQNHAIRRITPQGVVTTVAGNGTAGAANGAGSAARFNQPTGVCVSGDGKIYVADFANDLVRLIEFQ